MRVQFPVYAKHAPTFKSYLVKFVVICCCQPSPAFHVAIHEDVDDERNEHGRPVDQVGVGPFKKKVPATLAAAGVKPGLEQFESVS
jgi:hypothetical protein